MKNIVNFIKESSNIDYWDSNIWDKFEYECSLIPNIDEIINTFKDLGYKVIHEFDPEWVLVNVVVPENPDENISAKISKISKGKYDEDDYYNAYRNIFPYDSNEPDYKLAKQSWLNFKNELIEDLNNNL